MTQQGVLRTVACASGVVATWGVAHVFPVLVAAGGLLAISSVSGYVGWTKIGSIGPPRLRGVRRVLAATIMTLGTAALLAAMVMSAPLLGFAVGLSSAMVVGGVLGQRIVRRHQSPNLSFG